MGCGVIGTTSRVYPAVVESFSVYPGYTGTLRVRGMLSFVSEAGTNLLRMRGVLALGHDYVIRWPIQKLLAIVLNEELDH